MKKAAYYTELVLFVMFAVFNLVLGYQMMRVSSVDGLYALTDNALIKGGLFGRFVTCFLDEGFGTLGWLKVALHMWDLPHVLLLLVHIYNVWQEETVQVKQLRWMMGISMVCILLLGGMVLYVYRLQNITLAFLLLRISGVIWMMVQCFFVLFLFICVIYSLVAEQ
ncbi:MAG: hypothetical protein HUJ58_07940 [Erysipelotrichaceae bacterium]|nr:hypothetical protein [Erysipelotrichaceae bacterium]